ncbi:MAG: ATP-dependent Clp protease adaptor ClpS [Planctomycetota bacterium]
MDEELEKNTAVLPAAQTETRLTPLWHIVLLDDDDHTYDYVIEMLSKLFHHPVTLAYKMACEVDTVGRVIVETTVFERAEFKRGQIRAYGADWRLERSRGSMHAILEPATQTAD